MKSFSSLEEILEFHFKDKNLLKSALTHRSYLNEHPECSQEHNERLEFLGDAVLECIVSDFLYKNFQKPEGEMTNLRAALVRAETLSEIAKKLQIEDFLLLSKGEKNDKGRARRYILANALEAIIGAIYIDQGIEEAQRFISKKILVHLKEILKRGEIKDSKSRFQEMSQEKFNITPSYKILKKQGPDHRKEFLVGAYIGENLISEGRGFSKQEAEEEAAKEALRALNSKFQIPNNK
jgi:ribonuclease-3